jgi:flagellar hook protein FlgE
MRKYGGTNKGGHFIMMRALYSGVSGLRVHQTKMDVIGNNIANVNTVGFKSSSVTFSDIFYQTLQSATGPNDQTGAGGQNAKQIGLGANLASITTSVTKTGGSQRTDNASDLMISGDAFFIVNSGGTNYFTKAGAFGLDEEGNLVTPSGARVMGWKVDPNDSTQIKTGTVSPLRITSPENTYTKPEATTNTYLSGNIDYNDSQLKSGKTVNLEFYDNLGQKYTAVLRVTKTSANNEYNVTLDDIQDVNGKSIFTTLSSDGKTYTKSGFTGFTFAGIEYTVGEIDAETGKVKSFTHSGDPLLRFDASDGSFVGIGSGTNPTGKSIDLSIKNNTPATNPFETVNVDFSMLTMYENGGKTVIEPERGSVTDTGVSTVGAGKKAGKMTGYKIDTSGKIYGTYDNGDTKLLGQIAVATFNNPAGLESVGGNMFAQTLNSGTFDGIGLDITSTGGTINSGMLEMSNVDLASEFTEMITTQRGFQANSRIITTSDTMLEELINLKR